MQVQSSPSPCPPGSTYRVQAAGGTLPYTFLRMPSPPNPPGVELEVVGGVAHVWVPAGTPPGSQISVAVVDSGTPRQGAVSTNMVG